MYRYPVRRKYKNRDVYCKACGAVVIPNIDRLSNYCWTCLDCDRWWTIEIDADRRTMHEAWPGTAIRKEEGECGNR